MLITLGQRILLMKSQHSEQVSEIAKTMCDQRDLVQYAAHVFAVKRDAINQTRLMCKASSSFLLDADIVRAWGRQMRTEYMDVRLCLSRTVNVQLLSWFFSESAYWLEDRLPSDKIFKSWLIRIQMIYAFFIFVVGSFP